MRLVAVDETALAVGIVPGLMLADARAQVPDLVVHDHDPAADLALLERIADFCDRYTPMVALDPPDGVLIDITGCAHLFGDEASLARRLANELGGLGFRSSQGLAASPEAARGLARFGGLEEDIESLPVAALRLTGETEQSLKRAGLKTVGDLASRPSAPLSARFGEEATARFDRLIGRRDSRINPRRTPPALWVERRFAEPIGHVDLALEVIADLAREAAQTLEARHAGGRCFVARLYRSDGMLRDLTVETSLPSRDPKPLMRLFHERIEALSDPLDPGFGFDMIRLAVPVIEPLGASQMMLEGGKVSEDALAALIDRLGTRLGPERFRRFVAYDTHIPERAALARPVARIDRSSSWDKPEAGEPPLRPLHLFDPPQPIEVRMAEVPDGPPRQFCWRRRWHQIVRHEGPERIAAEWWRHRDNDGLSRDYFRVEDKAGHRFWVFRHGAYGGSKSPDWYVHGLFA